MTGPFAQKQRSGESFPSRARSIARDNRPVLDLNLAISHDHKEVTMKSLISQHTANNVTVQSQTPSSKSNNAEKRSNTARIALLFALAVTLAVSALAQEEIVGGPGTTYQNPEQIALKEWYPANLVAMLKGSPYNFNKPGGLVFDGFNMWISHAGTSYSVDKIRVSDNSKAGSYPVAGISAPVAFDGVNIWFSDHQPSVNVLHRLVAATGAPIADCSLGSAGYYPNGAAFDGQSMWVGTDDQEVIKLNAKTCAIECQTNIGSRAYGLAYDGNNGMWVTAADRNAVIKLSSSCTQTHTITVGDGPVGIVFDGTYMWTANTFGNSTSRIKVSSLAVSTYSLGSGFQPWSAAYDGANVWITDYAVGKVSKISTANPANNPPAYQTCGSASSQPLGLAFDGAQMWIGCEGSSVNAVGKM